jgi:flagellar basal-body rod modification protein FlgD
MSTSEVTSYYTSLLASSDTSTVTTTDSSSATDLTAEDFLTLLLTEIQYQDPTEPLDNAEMISQLTGYSQLDELTSINEQMESIADAVTSSSATNGLDYIGKSVEAEGDSIVKNEDDISSLSFTLGDDAASVTINIYDANGKIVNTVSMSDLDEGSYTFDWDGTDADGESADDGTYSVAVTAQDSDGDSVDVTTTTSGVVTGLQITSDGVILVLEDGRTVNMADVTSVTS